MSWNPWYPDFQHKEEDNEQLMEEYKKNTVISFNTIEGNIKKT